MRYCTNCGNPIDESCRFCTNCGADVVDDGPHPHEQQQAAPTATDNAYGAYMQDTASRHPASAESPTTTQPQAGPSESRPKSMAPFIAIIAALFVACGILTFVALSPKEETEPTKNEETVSISSNVEKHREPISTGSQTPTKDDTDTEEEPPMDISSGGGSQSTVTPNPSKPAFSGITSAYASSVYGDSSHYDGTYGYDAENVLDGKLDSAWAEGAPGWGVGESITLCGPYQCISGFDIWSGYQKNGSRGDLYKINARPQTISVLANGDVIHTQTLGDDGHVSQKVTFPEPVYTESITIRIDSVYEGSSSDSNEQDCCISEISCF